jgi:cytochrome c556
MKSILIFVAIAALSFMAFSSLRPAAAEDHEMHSDSHGEATSGLDPLINEMLVLDRAFQQVVSAVALGDGEKVEKALEAMHGTMEKTHEGLHEGTVRVPKNARRQEEFVEMDKKFHLNLERLSEAGRKNDQAEMLSLTKTLLEGCVNCHRDFRR